MAPTPAPAPATRPIAPNQAARPAQPVAPTQPNPQRANVNQPQPGPTTPQPRPNPQPQPGPTTPQPGPTTPQPGPQLANDPMQTFAPSTTLATSQPAGQLATEVSAEDIARQKRNEAAKKARLKKEARLVEYPGLSESYTDEQGNEQTRKVVLSSVPTDFNADLHRPLKSSEFNHRAVYLEWKAQEYDRLAAKARQDAEIARTQPAGVSRSAAINKKLAAMQAQIAVLRQQLEGSGVDVDAILRAAGLGPEQMEAAAQEAATEQPQAA